MEKVIESESKYLVDCAKQVNGKTEEKLSKNSSIE